MLDIIIFTLLGVFAVCYVVFIFAFAIGMIVSLFDIRRDTNEQKHGKK